MNQLQYEIKQKVRNGVLPDLVITNFFLIIYVYI